MKAIAVPCPNCERHIDTFRITANEDGTIVLHATCHPCRQVNQLTITLDDLKDLGAGKEVALRPASEPTYVM